MQPILAGYKAVLIKKVSPVSLHADYKKWLRYYFDFFSKYPLPDSRPGQVRLFIQKLREKKQTPVQQKQAAHALSLYYGLVKSGAKIINKDSQPQANRISSGKGLTIKSSALSLSHTGFIRNSYKRSQGQD